MSLWNQFGRVIARSIDGARSALFQISCYYVVLLLIVLFCVLFVFVLFYVLFACKCVLYYCHRVLTQLQLTNISLYFSKTRMVAP